MKKETLLHIAEPCHENWNDMTPEQQGRFCGSCCKTVVDFSTMSDKEILQTLSKAAGKTCGRFTQDQLQRPLVQDAPVMSKPRKIFLAAFIPTFVIANSVVAQNNNVTEKKVKSATEKVMKTGDIKGEIAFTEVDGTQPQAAFRKDGSSLKVPTTNTIEERSRIMGMVAMKPCSDDSATTVKTNSFNQEDKQQGELENAELNKTAVMMGGIEAYTKVTVADTIKTIVRKTFNQDVFKVFANPARVGGNISIQFKQAGTYTVQLLDASGRMYFSQVVIVSADKQQVVIKLPSNALAGSYFIRAIDDKKKKEYVDKILIK